MRSREQLLEILRSAEPIWKDEDHPDLAEGEAWVRKLRQESEDRFRRLFEDGEEPPVST